MNEWTIRQVANGYIVVPGHEASATPPHAAKNTHVFRTFAQAAAWIKRQMEPVA